MQYLMVCRVPLQLSAVVYLCAWYMASLVTLFLNKHILSTLKGNPQTLAMVQMTTTCVMGAVKVRGCSCACCDAVCVSVVHSRVFGVFQFGLLRADVRRQLAPPVLPAAACTPADYSTPTWLRKHVPAGHAAGWRDAFLHRHARAGVAELRARVVHGDGEVLSTVLHRPLCMVDPRRNDDVLGESGPRACGWRPRACVGG